MASTTFARRQTTGATTAGRTISCFSAFVNTCLPRCSFEINPYSGSSGSWPGCALFWNIQPKAKRNFTLQLFSALFSSSCSFQLFFFLGIRMYQDNNMLEKANPNPKMVAIIESIV